MKTIHFDNIDSTNTYLKNNYRFLENMTFVSSDYQSAGKGRNARIWKSEKGKNLLFSLLLTDDYLIQQYKIISILTSFCVIKTLEEYDIHNLSIKWPNDVYVNDKKICGILLEATSSSKLDCLVVGVGINVNQKEFEGDYLRKPTSMINELNKEINIEELKIILFKTIEDNLNNIDADYYSIIKEYDYLKDKEVYANIDNENKKIKVLGINNDYSLKIEYDNIIRDIEAGEISFHNEKD